MRWIVVGVVIAAVVPGVRVDASTSARLEPTIEYAGIDAPPSEPPFEAGAWQPTRPWPATSPVPRPGSARGLDEREGQRSRAVAAPSDPGTDAPETDFPETPDPDMANRQTAGPRTSAVGERPDHDQRGRAALDSISYPWRDRLPGWTIGFGPGQDGLLGLTLVGERRIEIYVRADQSDALLAHVIAHEIGHAVDVELNDGDERRTWQDTRGIGEVPWWPGDGVGDFSTGAGDFAEGFAVWQVGPSQYRGRLGPLPTTDQLELMARLAAG